MVVKTTRELPPLLTDAEGRFSVAAPVEGRRRLVELAPFTRPADDLGRYRLFGLQPGEDLVSAAVGQ